jgi:hypothetical protein
VYGATATGTQLLSYGAWSTSHEGGIAIEFLVDRVSLAFAALATAICGVVSAFSNRYLHRESGYNRYFVLLAMFVTGMLLVALAGNVVVLFIGWELVGLSSGLLVAFFQERPAAVSNAFRVLVVYRISDAAMLSAAVLLRHVAGTGSLSLLFGVGGTVDRRFVSRQCDAHRHPPDRRGRVQERAAAVFELAPASDGRTDAIERGLLRVAVDSRGLLPPAAGGAAARADADSAAARRRIGRGHGGVRGHHDTRAERREIVARLRLAHTGRDHRRRDRHRLVHARVHPPGRTRLLSIAAIPERAKRPARSARDGRCDRANMRRRAAATRGCFFSPSNAGFSTTFSIASSSIRLRDSRAD